MEIGKLVEVLAERTELVVEIRGRADPSVDGFATPADGESEAVVVNLMGEIQPEQFSGVMVALEVDAPGVENVRVAEPKEG